MWLCCVGYPWALSLLYRARVFLLGLPCTHLNVTKRGKRRANEFGRTSVNLNPHILYPYCLTHRLQLFLCMCIFLVIRTRLVVVQSRNDARGRLMFNDAAFTVAGFLLFVVAALVRLLLVHASFPWILREALVPYFLCLFFPFQTTWREDRGAPGGGEDTPKYSALFSPFLLPRQRKTFVTPVRRIFWHLHPTGALLTAETPGIQNKTGRAFGGGSLFLEVE